MTAMQKSQLALGIIKKSGSPPQSHNNSQYADQITKQDESQVQTRDYGADDLDVQKSIRQYPVPSIGGSHRSPQVNTKMPMNKMI